MKKFGLKIGLAALALSAAAPVWAQDYQTLASSQFVEPRALGSAPLKIELLPAGPLLAELANPSSNRRILMIVRGERNPHDKMLPVSVYWSRGTSPKALPPEENLLGLVTLNDSFGGKDHTTVLDVTDRLSRLALIKEIPEPQSPPPPSVTLVFPSDDNHPSGPRIEEILLVASPAGKAP